MSNIPRIHAAFVAGDLEALRRAVDDPVVVPNGPVPLAIGSCLVYAIYHSPLPFIRQLLDLGADPSAAAADGFPPLIAALGGLRDAPGTPRRMDAMDVLRLLLARGADVNQRGLNDWTPLHVAVGAGSALAVQVLLDAGADPDLRTRIDDCSTPLDDARAAVRADVIEVLARRGAPAPRRLRHGVTVLVDVPGDGAEVRRQQGYRTRVRTWLEDGTLVRPAGDGRAPVQDDGARSEEHTSELQSH